MRQRLDAIVGVAIVTACALLLLIGAYWQPKRYDGTPLGLYIAPGDTAVIGYVDADTIRVDTLYGLRAHILHLWVDTLDGLTHLHVDTLSVDSLTARLAHFDRADADTFDADSVHAVHLAGNVAELDLAYVDYLGSADQHVLRAVIDSLLAGHVGADTVDATIIIGDSLFGDGSNLTGIAGGDTSGLRSEWRGDIHDSLAAFTPGVSDHGSLTGLDDPADHPWAMQAADFPDSFAVEWPDSFAAAMDSTIAPAIHDTADVLRGEMVGITGAAPDTARLHEPRAVNRGWDNQTLLTLEDRRFRGLEDPALIYGPGLDAANSIAGPDSIRFLASDGRYLGVCFGASTNRRMALYRVNHETGAATKTDSLGGIVSIATDGKHWFLGTSDSQVKSYLVGNDGKLAYIDSTTACDHAAWVGAMIWDGRHLFAGSGWDGGSTAGGVATIDVADDGTLTRTSYLGSAASYPEYFWANQMVTDGRYLYVAGYIWGLCVYRIDQGTGALTATDRKNNGGYNNGVALAREFVIVTDGNYGGNVESFSVDEATGTLTSCWESAWISGQAAVFYQHPYLYMTRSTDCRIGTIGTDGTVTVQRTQTIGETWTVAGDWRYLYFGSYEGDGIAIYTPGQAYNWAETANQHEFYSPVHFNDSLYADEDIHAPNIDAIEWAMDDLDGLYRVPEVEFASTLTLTSGTRSYGILKADSLLVSFGDKLYSLSIDPATGALTKKDSLSTGWRGGGWYSPHDGYIYLVGFSVDNWLKRYSLDSAGAMAIVDSVQGDDKLNQVCGDADFIYATDDDGQVNVFDDSSGVIKFCNYKVANNSAYGRGIWADNEGHVYATMGVYGTYAYSVNTSTAVLTQIDNEDHGSNWASNVQGYGDLLFVANDYQGWNTYTISETGTLSLVTTWDMGSCHRGVWSDNGHVWYTTFYNNSSLPVSASLRTMWVTPLKYMAHYATSSFSCADCGDYGLDGSPSVVGDSAWVFADGGQYIHTYRRVAAFDYNPGQHYFSFGKTAEFDTALVNVELSVDLDGTISSHGYPLGVYDGAAYSRIESAGGSLVTSSSRRLKDTERPFGADLGDKLLALLDKLPIQLWRYKSPTNRGQHVGPLAEDWFPMARLVAPEAADSTQISQEHTNAALLLMVRALSRRQAAADSQIADLRRRVQAVEADTRWMK